MTLGEVARHANLEVRLRGDQANCCEMLLLKGRKAAEDGLESLQDHRRSNSEEHVTDAPVYYGTI